MNFYAFLDASLLTFLGVTAIPVLLYLRRGRMARVDRGFVLLVVGVSLVAVATFFDYSILVIERLEIRSIMESPLWQNRGTILALAFYFPGTVMAAFGLASWLPALQRLDGEIDQRRKAEAELIKANEQLGLLAIEADSASQAKSEFLTNMSHEFRTPLNAVIGFAQILEGGKRGPLTEDQRSFVGEIREAAGLLLNIVGDILDISKIEAGKLEARFEDMDVPRAIESSVKMIAPRADEANIELTTEVPSGTPNLYADERLVKQMLINLLSNAVKFTRAGGRISIAVATSAEEGLKIMVRDNGIGMAAEDIPKALTTFGQINNPEARQDEGTGLGLPLVKSFMEVHDGTLEIESEVGTGTEVRLTFPAERIRLSQPMKTGK
jgi:signal transduction histidine kinase